MAHNLNNRPRRHDVSDFKAYPNNTRVCVRLSGPVMNFWHAAVDHCPSLLKIDPPHAEKLFIDFMRFAEANALHLDWTLYLNIYRWLQRDRQVIANDCLEEVVLAAAASWAYSDNQTAAGILITHPCLAPCAVKATARSAHLEDYPIDVPAPFTDFMYGLLSTSRETVPHQWLNIL